jgi:hypothetical protein
VVNRGLLTVTFVMRKKCHSLEIYFFAIPILGNWIYQALEGAEKVSAASEEYLSG